MAENQAEKSSDREALQRRGNECSTPGRRACCRSLTYQRLIKTRLCTVYRMQAFLGLRLQLEYTVASRLKYFGSGIVEGPCLWRGREVRYPILEQAFHLALRKMFTPDQSAASWGISAIV